MAGQSGDGEQSGVPGGRLAVYMLGVPDIHWEDRPLNIPRRQARALLYYLATQPQPTPRERLVGLFWPDTAESMARRNLSRLLALLRQALPDPTIILATSETVALDPERNRPDVAVFEQSRTRPEHQRTLEDLRQAAELYRGSFLAGFSLPDCPEFDTWAEFERQTWQNRFLEVLSALVEAYAGQGDSYGAITTAQRYLAVDGLAEEMHRRLIELYALSGDRRSALRQFETCTVLLERELGVSPLPETWHVYRAVLEGRSVESAVAISIPAPALLSSAEVPLVGRQRALQRLEQAFSQVQARHGQFLLIAGEMGIGKSRLMLDFARRVQDRAVVLPGASHPGAQSMPYHLAVEALRGAVAGRRTPIRVHTTWLAEAARVLPELYALHPDLPSSVPAELAETRIRLVEALVQVVLGLSADSRPLVFCLDDLHYADRASFDWLAYLGRRLEGRRILVLGTYRREQQEAVAELRQDLARLGALSELTLKGLNAADVTEILRHLIGRHPGDEALGGRLWQVTGGNPFFAVETIRALAESGALPGTDDVLSFEDLPLPNSIRDAVRARLQSISPLARQVMEAGSVCGLSFELDLLLAVAGRAEMETLDGLDELVARDLLADQGNIHQFRHELIRTAVYQQLGYGRRRLLHRRAAMALQKLKPGDATSLAWHFERADEPGEAAWYTLQAGQAARDVLAPRLALGHFDRARAWLTEQAGHLLEPEAIAENLRLQFQAAEGRGWALNLLGEMEMAAQDLPELARLAERLGDPAILARLRWREASTHRWFCRHALARQSAEEGIRLSRVAGYQYLEALCPRELGLATRSTGDYAQARAALEASFRLLMEQHDSVYQIRVIANLSGLYWYLQEYDRALSLADLALLRCREVNLPLERRLPLAEIGAAATALGQIDLARTSLQESLAIGRQIGDRPHQILCLGHLGWLALRIERPASAQEHLWEGLKLSEDIHSCTRRSWLLAGLAEAERQIGDRERSLNLARRALEQAEANDQAFERRLAEQILARLDACTV